jgi:predicted peptidase
VYTPAGYDADPAARWPLFVMLHGNFPRTPDSTIPTSGNESQLANIQRLKLPFVVLTPLCPPDQYWSNDALVECIAQVQAKYRIDADRIYLCGCSMGGYGAFALAGERPDVFAAMIAGCGGGDPRDAARFKGLPVRVLHGAKDEVVPLRSSQEMVDALKAAGCPVEFVVLPEAGHDIGTESFADPALYQWLLSHRRSDRAAASTQPAAPPQ